ncbi:hypothetical protein BLNAU_17363 [Blattamonas nauphoetae]|uniref:Transmembrane protein n=1 Tax=Blattamonas nauphoetae TaxID=2049346 RepID=A0ABQ9X7B4_9EUKA|nr:hypothetical protein BLNAU_17363 [Blattamonas nauphoetae]
MKAPPLRRKYYAQPNFTLVVKNRQKYITLSVLFILFVMSIFVLQYSVSHRIIALLLVSIFLIIGLTLQFFLSVIMFVEVTLTFDSQRDLFSCHQKPHLFFRAFGSRSESFGGYLHNVIGIRPTPPLSDFELFRNSFDFQGNYTHNHRSFCNHFRKTMFVILRRNLRPVVIEEYFPVNKIHEMQDYIYQHYAWSVQNRKIQRSHVPKGFYKFQGSSSVGVNLAEVESAHSILNDFVDDDPSNENSDIINNGDDATEISPDDSCPLLSFDVP